MNLLVLVLLLVGSSLCEENLCNNEFHDPEQVLIDFIENDYAARRRQIGFEDFWKDFCVSFREALEKDTSGYQLYFKVHLSDPQLLNVIDLSYYNKLFKERVLERLPGFAVSGHFNLPNAQYVTIQQVKST